jgi:hypothetical protein
MQDRGCRRCHLQGPADHTAAGGTTASLQGSSSHLLYDREDRRPFCKLGLRELDIAGHSMLQASRCGARSGVTRARRASGSTAEAAYHVVFVNTLARWSSRRRPSFLPPASRHAQIPVLCKQTAACRLRCAFTSFLQRPIQLHTLFCAERARLGSSTRFALVQPPCLPPRAPGRPPDRAGLQSGPQTTMRALSQADSRPAGLSRHRKTPTARLAFCPRSPTLRGLLTRSRRRSSTTFPCLRKSRLSCTTQSRC